MEQMRKCPLAFTKLEDCLAEASNTAELPEQKAMKEYEVFLEAAEEGGYVVTCPTLPGCVSEGETREAALANIKDAIQCYLTTLRRHGGALPRVETEIVEVAA